MIQIRTLTLGAYQTNCYMVWGGESRECVVIDPGYDAPQILEAAGKLGKSICAILLTHGHFDHVGAVRDLAAETDCPVWLCAEDTQLPEVFTAGKLYYTNTYSEGDTVTAAGVTFHVLHTPGHTPGSVCLMAEDVLFSGDTLFAGSCGRTDLPGGDWATILRSLRRLQCLQTDYTVCPGHGETTTLFAEKQYNPYMR